MLVNTASLRRCPGDVFFFKFSSVLRGTGDVCVQSGYKTVTPIEIANCLQANLRGELSYRGVRVFFGCLAMMAVREAAARSNTRKGRRPCSAPRFRSVELSGLTGLPESVVKREIRILGRLSILSFAETEVVTTKMLLRPENEKLCSYLCGKRSPKRPIPVPRVVLRFVARSGKGAISKTLLAHIVRGLTLKPRTGEICAAGTVKASWIANTFGLSLRSVKAARKELIEMGLISKDTGSFQRKLNRDGAYFVLNLSWADNPKVWQSEGEASPKISPLRVKTHPKIAPPYKDKKTSYESKNQKTKKTPGVCIANEGPKPKLQDVRPEDIKSSSRLHSLYAQAVKARWLVDSESNLLNWFGAAVRAQTVDAKCPVRVFLGIVKSKRWEFITQAQEDRARSALIRIREREERESCLQKFHGPEKSRKTIDDIVKKLKF